MTLVMFSLKSDSYFYEAHQKTLGMDKISTILVPFDFSKSARVALEYTVAFIGVDDIQLILAYVSGNENFTLSPTNFIKLEDEYQGILKKNLKWINQDGLLIETLLAIQNKIKPDLIIMGTLGISTHGSTQETNTSKLILVSNCPVLSVPSNYKTFQIKHIALILVKNEIENTKVLGTFSHIIKRFNAKVHVVILENLSDKYGNTVQEEKNENALAYYLEDFYVDHVFIKDKELIKGILNYLSNYCVDLITILPRNYTRHGTPTKEQLTQLFIVHSKLPVLTIK